MPRRKKWLQGGEVESRKEVQEEVNGRTLEKDVKEWGLEVRSSRLHPILLTFQSFGLKFITPPLRAPVSHLHVRN